MLDKGFWKDKKVFITGNTGFKGSWLSIWLSSLGSKVYGYSLEPENPKCLFEIANLENIIKTQISDIRDYKVLSQSINNFNPDIVFHLAAQPLVRRSYKSPIETYETNVMGTANFLDISRKSSSIKAVINITTDKCYENREEDYSYIESDPMGGYDPYSSSKGCAELVTSAYQRSFFNELNIGLASVRAGNVIGGGDWSQDRLIPDILNAFNSKKEALIRFPKAVRPWQHVLEPLSGYLILAEKLYTKPLDYSSSWNFGPNSEDNKSVESIVSMIAELMPGSSWKIDDRQKLHEANLLKLNIDKSKKQLNWRPVWNLSLAIEKIIRFNNAWLNNQNIFEYCLSEISEYENDQKNLN